MDFLISVLPLVGKVLMAAGTFFLLTSVVGLVRFPDFFARLHPAGIADSAGAPLVLLGVALQFPLGLVTLKVLLLILIALVTAATACHALAQAALPNKKPAAKKRKRA